jgi:hypothetical protein
MSYGFGCGIVVDGQDRVYVTSRSTNPCVAVFDKKGNLLETWANDFAEKVSLTTTQVKDTAHCLYWSKEPGGEFFYWTENVANGKDGAKIGKRSTRPTSRAGSFTKSATSRAKVPPRRSSTGQIPPTSPWRQMATSTSWTVTAASA